MTAFSLFLTSCSKDDDNGTEQEVTINPKSISLYAEETFQLSATNAVAWSIGDDFIAKVDNKGLVTGGHVGTTTITAKNGRYSATCEVTVNPKYNLYDTPVLDWGASMSAIQSKETHSKSSSSSSSTMLAYDYSKNGTSYALFYFFEGGRMSRIVVYTDYLLYVNATKYLQERYYPMYAEKTDYFLMFADAYTKDKMKTVVGIQTTKLSGTDMTMISYIPAN